MTPVGLTRDAGWEIGVSATWAIPVGDVWEFLVSAGGLGIWLGAGVEALPQAGGSYTTEDGTRGEVRSRHERDRVRLTWRPPGWDHDSTVQVSVQGSGPGKTRVGFHQERLASAEERELQREHWRGVLARLADAARDVGA